MNTNNMSPQRSRLSQHLSAAVSAVLSLAAAAATQAGPHNGIVTSGEATISTPDLNLTQIDQGSHSASIDWQSFDVAAQERVIFNQPSASSVTLNRILTQDPSQIHGSITANGRVFLINPNGIIFGASSRINVGSLVASSLDIADVDAATGRYSFSTAADRSGAISNSGQIIAADGGSVTLLGGSVANNGLIVADFGSVNLGAGRAATLHFDGDGLVRFEVDAGLLSSANGAGAAVDNTGEILANGGQVLLTARAASDVIARAVNNDGVIRAARVENAGGRIRLVGAEGVVVNSGTLDAAGVDASSSGGEVQVLGNHVELTGTSLVDVSGSAGGGTALIGGSFRGEDPAVLNAQQTDVLAGAVIRADSTLSGDAGQVAVWSDGTTAFHGDIFAQATGSDGSGGYAEVSGREHLSVSGHAWLESANGAAGVLLLDPGSVTITNGGNSAPPASLDTFRDGWINSQLGNSDVIISTASSTNSATQDLTVDSSADISWASAHSLTLIGNSSVSLAAGSSISGTGAGALVLQSGGAVSIGGAVSLLTGDLTVTAGTGITQSAALDIGGASSFTAAAGQSLTFNNAGNSFGGSVRFSSGGPGNLQDIAVVSSTALDLQALTLNGNLNVTADAITQSGALSVAGTSSFTAAGGKSIVLGNSGNSFGDAVSFASAGTLQDVNVYDSNALDLQALSIVGNLTVNAQQITQTAGALVIGGTSSFTAADGQSIVLSSIGNSFGGGVSFSSRGPGDLQYITVVSSTALDLQALTIDGDLNVTANAITQSGALTVADASSFTAAGGQSIVLGNSGNSFGGTVSFVSAGTLQDVTVYDSTALDLQALTITGNLNVGAGATVTQSGALVVGGTADFAATAGRSIVLNNSGNVFTGAVNIATSGAGTLQNVTLRDSTALNLQALTIAGDLSIASGAAISQSGPLSVAGAASFRTLNDAGAAITLAGTNSFGSVQASVRNAADTVNAAASIVIHESDGTVLGDVQTAAGQSVSVESAGAITALANTNITASSVSLVAAGDIGSTAAPVSLVTSNGHISADSGGSVYLTNASGAGSVALDHIVAGSTGAIGFVSDGDIQVANIQAGNAVSLTSTNGSIVDDNVNGAGSQLVTGDLTLLAAGAIGQATGVGNGTLDLQVGSVSATAQGGGIYLDETGTDIGIRQVNAAGPVWIQAATGSILDDPADASAASITSTTGGVQLGALNNIGAVTDLRARQGAAIGINTHGGALSAHVASATGQINLDIASGSNPTAAAAAISAGGSGRLLIQSAGDLSLNSFNAAIAGFSEAGFSSDATLHLSGQQSDLIAGPLATLALRGGNDIAQADRVFALSADHLVFDSGAQGGDVMLNTNVNQLDAAVGNGANLTVVEGGDIALGSITADGNVSIGAANIFDDGDINGITRVAAGNALSLHASASIGREDGTSGGRIDTAGNSVAVLADAGPIFISHLGDLQVSGEAHGGLIDIAAPTGSITLNGLLRASDSLTLTAGGAITDADDAATYLSATNASLAATLIGSQNNRLNIDVASLDAHAASALYLNAANSVQLRNIAAPDVVISALGNITDDGDAQTRITAGNVALSGSAIGAAGAGNEIDTAIDSLTATASAGGIYIGELDNIELAAVNANGAGNDVVITASGAITDDGDNTTRVAGGNLILAATAIGAVNSELDTQATSLTTNASSGGVFISEADDLQLNTIAGSEVAITAAGALTDDGNDATRVTADSVTLAGSRIGVAGSRVDTAAAVLSATAGNGGIYLDEQDSVTLADVRSSGAGNEVDLRTGNNGSITIQNLTTQGGAVNLTAGGTGSLQVTGAIASNNGLVNLISGNALAVPGLSTGSGNVVLHTVNDLNVGTITAGSITITSDIGNISLGTVNAGTGTASITADNGTISDGAATSLTAGHATLSARSIGSEDNPLNIAVGTLTADTSAGGLFVEETDGLTIDSISSAGRINLATGGSLIQQGAITSAADTISVSAAGIDMLATAVTNSSGGNITYVANSGDATLGVLDAGAGRALLIAADNVFSALGPNSATSNITASTVEIRAGGRGAGPGEIGTASNPLTISTSSSAIRSIFLIVPIVNGIQTSTPRINYAGASSSILLKGYSGTSGSLLFDQSNAFTSDTVLGNGESIVPLLNGRIAINSDSLRAARQALSSGVVNTVSVDWAAFDPNVSLFGTLDPPLRLPADQIDEAGAGL